MVKTVAFTITNLNIIIIIITSYIDIAVLLNISIDSYIAAYTQLISVATKTKECEFKLATYIASYCP